MNKYNIAFKGLDAGEHVFDLEIGDRFFDAFENTDIRGGKLNARVLLRKTGGGFVISCRIMGNVTVECDRCLEDCVIPVDYEGDLAVKFTAEKPEPGEEYDGEVLWLPQDDGELNIAQYLYESIILSLPYQRVHEDENGDPACDPEILKRFEIISEEEFDERFAEDSYVIEDSPAGEQLRELKDRLENE